MNPVAQNIPATILEIGNKLVQIYNSDPNAYLLRLHLRKTLLELYPVLKELIPGANISVPEADD